MSWNSLTRICIKYDEETDGICKASKFLNEINSTTSLGSTPLHFVALGSNHMLAKFLMVMGAKFTPNDFNETPLHWAAKEGSLKVVKVFLKYYSVQEILFYDNENYTALDWAIEYERNEIVVEFKKVIATKI